MTITAFAEAIKTKKPAIIRERNQPRYVVMDWKTYQTWSERLEDLEDHERFDVAIAKSRGKKRFTLNAVKKRYHLA